MSLGPAKPETYEWTGSYTTITYSGAITSRAYAIDNEGVMVGNYFYGPGVVAGTEGFVFRDGAYDTLNGFNYLSEEQITYLTGINDFDEISGYQMDGLGGGTHSFVATPVPEPECIGLVATGVIALASLRLRRVR